MAQRVVVLIGPTATGKSSLGLRLAQFLDSEIISGDSMLVYRGFDIGTAKPTQAELKRVPHYLVDICSPTEVYTVADFQQQAGQLICAINARGRLPLVVGGTGLYIKALLENYQFAEVGKVTTLRQSLEARVEAEGVEKLWGELATLSPTMAAEIDRKNPRRVVRALEVALSGDTLSRNKDEALYDALVIGLTAPREYLYKRIEARVDAMVEAGLFTEVKELLRGGVPEEAKAFTSIGYRQVVAYYQGLYTRDECIARIKQATRNFAKRQGTFLRQMPYIKWLDISAQGPEEVYQQVLALIHKRWATA